MVIRLARRVFEFARKGMRSRRLRRQVPDADWRGLSERHGIPPARIAVDGQGCATLRLERNAPRLPKTASGLAIAASYQLLDKLDRYTACTMAWNEARDGLMLAWGAARYFADCHEEIYILAELYLTGDYDFLPCGPAVAIDVGANVGFASIFLADQFPEMNIEGYEPLGVNFSKALLNLAENPHVASRIRFVNAGLYSASGSMQMTSEVGQRGMSSLVLDRRASGRNEVEVEDIEVTRASDIVTETRRRYPGRDLVLKMDCEGSEYAIFAELADSGALSLVEFVVMEWHRTSAEGREVESLRALLRANGFHTWFNGRLQSRQPAGMAIAFRRAGVGATTALPQAPTGS